MSGSVLVAATATILQMSPGQISYTQSCGGCHGLSGVSALHDVPVLRDQVGKFLCSREGRDYVARLPNVAFAAVDDATLAELLNFMMSAFGGRSLPDVTSEHAKPFTAREVRDLRANPLKGRDLLRLRAEVLAKGDPVCLGTDHRP